MTELVGSLDINLPALFFMKPVKLNLHRMVGFSPAPDQTWDKLLPIELALFPVQHAVVFALLRHSAPRSLRMSYPGCFGPIDRRECNADRGR
jgi:hypothetical protein